MAQDFYGPDLAGLLCACGLLHKDPPLWMWGVGSASAEATLSSLGGPSAAAAAMMASSASASSQTAAIVVPEPAPSPAVVTAAAVPVWRDAVAAEARYQLSEFTSDFGAFDLAQLVLGLADLEVPVDSDLRSAIMKVCRGQRHSQQSTIDCAL